MSDTIKVALIIAAAPMLTVLLTWWQQRKSINKVHVLVNSQRDEMLEEIRQLKIELRESKSREAH